MNEIWREIDGFHDYRVSNTGKVKSIKHNKELILKPSLSNGYQVVPLYNNGIKSRFKVHRLVASAFVENPNPYEFDQINHKDENKLNNNADNLEWCNQKYNNNYGNHGKKISEAKINNKSRSKTVLCVETGCVYPSTREVERQTGFDNTCISDCCRGKRKVAYGYHWKYL